jgi:hypothetical protein
MTQPQVQKINPETQLFVLASVEAAAKSETPLTADDFMRIAAETGVALTPDKAKFLAHLTKLEGNAP